MNQKQKFQEDLYNFNYHYIPEYRDGNFKHFKAGAWFLEYMAFIEFLKQYLKKYNFNNLIDIEYGDGRIVYELAKAYPNKQFLGIDILKKAIGFAQNINNLKNLNYKCMDIKECQEQFDIILLIEVFEHIPPSQRKTFLNSIKKRMKDNFILIVILSLKNIRLDLSHYEHFTFQTFLENFQTFNLIETKFIAKKSIVVTLFYKLLENNLFILRHQKLLNYIFHTYKNRYLIHHNEKRALRILGVFEK